MRHALSRDRRKVCPRRPRPVTEQLERRGAVEEGRAAAEGWPEWMNVPSKVGQVAAYGSSRGSGERATYATGRSSRPCARA